jgi:hypothetical protein
VLYRAFFGHVEFLEKAADKLESQGQDGSELRDFYKNTLGLSNRDVTSLKQHSATAQQERRRIAKRVQEVVQEGRAKFPGGRILANGPLPEPPAELFQLFEELDEVAVREIDLLAATVGSIEFQKIDRYLRQDFAKNVTYVATPPAPPNIPPNLETIPAVGR